MKFYAKKFSLNRIFCAALILMLMISMCCGMPSETVSAANTSSPDWSMSGDSSISVTLKDEDGNTTKSGELTLYLVADFKEDAGSYSYTYTNEFKNILNYTFSESGNGSGISLDEDDLISEVSGDSAELAEKFAEYVSGKGITGTVEKNSDGTVTFDNLEFGLYLIVQTEAAEGYNTANPFIVTLPMYEDEKWVYEIDASPKVGLLTSSGGTTDDPNEPNTGTDDPDEPNTGTDDPDDPDTGTTEEAGGTSTTGTTEVTDGTSSTVTTTGTYESETKLPQTGQLFWPIPVLLICGGILFLVGAVMVFIDRRKTRHCEL